MVDSLPTAIDIKLEGGKRTTGALYRSASPSAPRAALVLAHGAGAGQRHPFMVAFANGLSRRDVDVLTFNFLYMQQQRHVPDRMPELVACYQAAIAAAQQHLPIARQHLFIGGKSMGGRAATHVVSSIAPGTQTVSGLVLLGYPLHPPGRPDQLRDAHLPHVRAPMLFVQGSRDTFGTPEELVSILERLSPRPALHVVDGGDHSFKVSGKDAAAKQPAVYSAIQDIIVEWMATISNCNPSAAS